MCGHFDFPFPTLKSSSKNFFKFTTFKFLNFTIVNILEIKESGTCQKWSLWGANSCTLLLLNLISQQMEIYLELIDVSEYQSSAYLH